MNAPRVWPHVVLDDGPDIAGLTRGDCVAVAPDDWIFVRSFFWTDERQALAIESTAFGHTSGDAWRVRTGGVDGARLEHIDYGGRFGSGAQWQAAASDQVRKEPWTLRFVVDGPPLATIKRFGDITAVHPRVVGANYGEGAFSEWIVPSEGARDVLLVTEAADGTLTWRTERRRTGLPLAMLRALAADDIDAEIAAGIVAQMADTQPMSYVGFDGVVRAIDGARSTYREPSRAQVFALLTQGAFAPLSNNRERKASTQLAETQPAPPALIASVMRALYPDAWAREQALVEECGVLAG